MNAITAEGLVKVYRSRKNEVRALDGVDLRGPGEGTILACSARTAPARPRRVRILATLLRSRTPGHADGRRLRRGQAGAAAPSRHRTVRPVRRGRREPDRSREPGHVRPALPAARRPRPRRAPNELLEQFELTDAGDRVVKTYSGGMRRRLDLGSALIGRPRAAVPRRAHDRARSAQPPRHVGRHPRPRPRGHDAAADDPVPRRGRRTGRHDRGRRPRQDHRPRHRGSSSSRDLGGARVEVVVHTRDDIARAAEVPEPRLAGEADARRAHPQADRAGPRRRPGARPGRARPRRGRHRASTTSPCVDRRSTRSSSA